MMLDYFINSGYYSNHPMNVYEDQENLYIELRAVGVKKENLSVKFENGILEINTTQEKDEEKPKYIRQEFREDRYLGTKLEIPYEIDSEKIEAILKFGILKIKLPKDQTSSKMIEVK